MKKVYYPEIEGGTDIVGWVDNKGISYTLVMGEVTQVKDYAVDSLLRTFSFLKIDDSREYVPKKTSADEKGKEIVKKAKTEKKKETEKYVCEKCKKTCKSFAGLMVHKRSHEKKKTKTTE